MQPWAPALSNTSLLACTADWDIGWYARSCCAVLGQHFTLFCSGGRCQVTSCLASTHLWLTVAIPCCTKPDWLAACMIRFTSKTHVRNCHAKFALTQCACLHVTLTLLCHSHFSQMQIQCLNAQCLCVIYIPQRNSVRTCNRRAHYTCSSNWWPWI